MGDGGVAIGYCHPEFVSGQFVSSLTGVLIQSDIIDGVISMMSSPRIASTRNQIIRKFLTTNAEYLLMVDADMTFDADVVDRMTATMRDYDLTLLGGLAFVLSRETGNLAPTLNVITNANPIETEPVFDYPQNSVVKIDTTGAACLMMHRTVLLDVLAAHKDSPLPWFAETVNGNEEIGEDVTFCIRAKNAGHDLYAHTGIRFGHMKTQPLTEETYRAWRVDTDKKLRKVS